MERICLYVLIVGVTLAWIERAGADGADADTASVLTAREIDTENAGARVV